MRYLCNIFWNKSGICELALLNLDDQELSILDSSSMLPGVAPEGVDHAVGAQIVGLVVLLVQILAQLLFQIWIRYISFSLLK